PGTCIPRPATTDPSSVATVHEPFIRKFATAGRKSCPVPTLALDRRHARRRRSRRSLVRRGAQGAGADAAAEDPLVLFPLPLVQDLARVPHRLLEIRVALAVQLGELLGILL